MGARKGSFAIRLLGVLPSPSRTEVLNNDRDPAMNRWAIFVRPLRGLLMQNRQSQLLRCWKIKIPPPLPLRKTQQAGDGIFLERENSHCGLNTLCAKCPKLLSAFGQVSWLCFALAGERIHSGATARDSHPLPYSPRFDARHPNACQKSEIKNL